MTKADAAERWAGGQALSKRGPPTLGAILKYVDLFKKLRAAVDDVEAIRTMVSARAEHVTNPMTNQDILKSPDTVNQELRDLLCTPADVPDTLPTFTAEDLPKLPDFTGDKEKDEKAQNARRDLATEIAQLGSLFTG